MNNTAATPVTSTHSFTFRVVRPIYGSKAHAGYVQTSVYSDGRTYKTVSTFCAVSVKYDPSKTPAMPLDEVAAAITCPQCIKRAAHFGGLR